MGIYFGALVRTHQSTTHQTLCFMAQGEGGAAW